MFFSEMRSSTKLQEPETNLFHSGGKENTLPAVAKATVNHRIHPNDTIQEIIKRDKAVINDDRVEINVLSGLESSPVSEYNTFCFETLRDCVYR